MTQKLVISDAGEILQPVLHDGLVQGLILVSDTKLLIPIMTENGVALCLALSGVERLRVDDFRQGNIILDVSVSSGANIEMDDVAYAYGLKSEENLSLLKIMDRLIKEQYMVVKVNPSYGCTLVCICCGIEIENDWRQIIIN